MYRDSNGTIPIVRVDFNGWESKASEGFFTHAYCLTGITRRLSSKRKKCMWLVLLLAFLLQFKKGKSLEGMRDSVLRNQSKSYSVFSAFALEVTNRTLFLKPHCTDYKQVIKFKRKGIKLHSLEIARSLCRSCRLGDAAVAILKNTIYHKIHWEN